MRKLIILSLVLSCFACSKDDPAKENQEAISSAPSKPAVVSSEASSSQPVQQDIQAAVLPVPDMDNVLMRAREPQSLADSLSSQRISIVRDPEHVVSLKNKAQNLLDFIKQSRNQLLDIAHDEAEYQQEIYLRQNDAATQRMMQEHGQTQYDDISDFAGKQRAHQRYLNLHTKLEQFTAQTKDAFAGKTIGSVADFSGCANLADLYSQEVQLVAQRPERLGAAVAPSPATTANTEDDLPPRAKIETKSSAALYECSQAIAIQTYAIRQSDQMMQSLMAVMKNQPNECVSVQPENMSEAGVVYFACRPGSLLGLKYDQLESDGKNNISIAN